MILPGQQLDSAGGVRVQGQYRYLPQAPDERQGESCTVLQLARDGRRGQVTALVEFGDFHQQAVGAAWLRKLNERFVLAS